MNTTEAGIYCYEEFQEWCDVSGVSMEHDGDDDWEPWWECWKAAIDIRMQRDE